MSGSRSVWSQRHSLLRGLSYPLFRRLLAAQVMFGFANWMNRLAVGYLVLDETGSMERKKQEGYF